MTVMISCGKCRKRWTGKSTSHCGACHETFSGIAAFDAHQRNVPDGRMCAEPESKKLIAREKPWGTVWGYESGDFDYGALANEKRIQVD